MPVIKMRLAVSFFALCLGLAAPALADDEPKADKVEKTEKTEKTEKKHDKKKDRKKPGKPVAGDGSGSAAAEAKPAEPVYSGPKATLPTLEVARRPADLVPEKPRTPGADDAKAIAILEKIVAAPDRAGREAAIKELNAIAPHAIDAIGEWLVRTPRRSSIEDRRSALLAIKAAVPDKTGKFNVPQRETEKELKADDAIDWLAKLLELDAARPGVGELIADDAAIHALVETKDPRAATYVFDAAFAADTMIYRDECGRYLRKMEPYSIPALTRGAQSDGDRRRYATFQLERLDRQEPGKALNAAAGDEALGIAILDVFRTTHHREAVHAVWAHVNDDSHRLRQAAREAFIGYIMGPPPPPAPKKKLQLPGGKETKYPKPMWLTYRELADNELRKAANELLHEDYPIEDPSTDDREEKKVAPIDLGDTAARLFGYYDELRSKAETAQWTEAKTKFDAGDLAASTQLLDRLLAQNPDHGQRREMAKVYLAWAKQLEGKAQWPEAAAAYSKVQGLDPEGAAAKDALAAHHYALGKSLEAQGKDGGPDFRRAIALKPDYAPAKVAEASSASGSAGRPLWMLYAAASAGVLALLLFAAAMLRRRA